MWYLKTTTSKEIAFEIEKIVPEEVVSFSSLEKNAQNRIWEVEILCQAEPETHQIIASMPLSIQNDCTWETGRLEQKDWLKENRNSFPAIEIGNFYIYGAHLKDQVPPSKVGLQLDASTAFGTGEHATTKGCLLAIEALSKSKNFKKPIDIGCGTGILALGIAALLKIPVVAVDNDPEAVQKTIENSITNKLSEFVESFVSEGWRNVKTGPYDLVVANILADPLCDLAPSMSKHTCQDGILILSGLLDNQKDLVLNAYNRHNFLLLKGYPIDGWETLVLKKDIY